MACSRDEAAHQAAGRAAAIACSAPRHDFGRAPEGATLKHTFVIENRGGAVLSIQRVESSYTCRAVAPPGGVPPGQAAKLEVECPSRGRPGRLSDVIVVYSNARENARLELALEADLEPLLAFESTLVELAPSFGSGVSKDVHVRGQLAPQAGLRVESVTEREVRVELLLATREKPAGLRLTLDASRVGRGAGHVLVSTGLDEPKELILPYSFEVKGHLRVEPSRPYINLREPGVKRARVNVTSDRDDFVLRSVEFASGPFEATFSRASDGKGYLVEVVAPEEHLPADTRGLAGELVLVSNDPFEPRKSVPVFAFGIPNSEPD